MRDFLPDSPTKAPAPSAVEELRQLVQENLLRSLANGRARLFSLHPPLQLPFDVRVVNKSTPLLCETGQRRSHTVNHWPELGLNSGCYPILCCVLEGVADWRAGVTKRMAAGLTGTDTISGQYALRLPPQTFFLIPQGVPFDDGSRSHWDEAFGESTPSQMHTRILWIEVLPTGAIIHTCISRGHSHATTPGLFIFDPQLTILIEALASELKSEGLHDRALATHYLSCLLLRLDRALATGQVARADGGMQTPNVGSGAPSISGHCPEESAPIQRACRYIEANLSKPLTIEVLASQSFVSPAQLNRLFNAHFQTSPMKIVAQRRIEAAQTLLRNTNLPIREIGGYVGFGHLSHFSRQFTQIARITPSQYRKTHRAETSTGPKTKPSRKID